MDREERIRARAHQIWESEGQPDGRDSEHWERARLELDGGEEQASTASEGGLSSGLQPGGTIPGSSPASGMGSLGTGGGSTNRRRTGGAAKKKT